MSKANEETPNAVSTGHCNGAASINDDFRRVIAEAPKEATDPTLASSFSSEAAGIKAHRDVVENFRPMKIIVIGAGYSGIYHGIRIPERIKNCELVIYEKNAGVGGAW
jgi:hypothetical protein